MHLDPLPFVRRNELRAVLQNQQNQVQQAGNIRGNQGEPLFAYLEWANRAADQLGTFLTTESVRQLVLTDRYRTLLTAGPRLIGGVIQQQRVLNDLINSEIKDRMTAFDAAIKALEVRIRRWSQLAMFVVADTSFYMQHEDVFDEIDLHTLLGGNASYAEGGSNIHLLVPLAVVDELDAQKRRHEPDKRKRARHVLAVLDNLFRDPNAQPILSPRGTSAGSRPITMEILFDPPHHTRLARTDDEIIERMVTEQPVAARPFTLVTYDTGMSTRARRAGLKVIKLTEPEPPPRPQKEKGTQFPGTGKPSAN